LRRILEKNTMNGVANGTAHDGKGEWYVRFDGREWHYLLYKEARIATTPSTVYIVGWGRMLDDEGLLCWRCAQAIGVAGRPGWGGIGATWTYPTPLVCDMCGAELKVVVDPESGAPTY